MIQTFIIDEPVLIFIGVFAAFFLPKDFRGSVFSSRAFWGGAYLAMGFMALAAYGYFVAPDWMFMYFVESQKIPQWMVIYLFAVYFLLYVLGFILKVELSKVHPLLPWIALLFTLAASIGVVLPVASQYRTVATFQEYHSGLGVPLSQSAVSKNTTLPALFLFVSGILLLIFWARRQKT